MIGRSRRWSSVAAAAADGAGGVGSTGDSVVRERFR